MPMKTTLKEFLFATSIVAVFALVGASGQATAAMPNADAKDKFAKPVASAQLKAPIGAKAGTAATTSRDVLPAAPPKQIKAPLGPQPAALQTPINATQSQASGPVVRDHRPDGNAYKSDPFIDDMNKRIADWQKPIAKKFPCSPLVGCSVVTVTIPNGVGGTTEIKIKLDASGHIRPGEQEKVVAALQTAEAKHNDVKKAALTKEAEHPGAAAKQQAELEKIRAKEKEFDEKIADAKQAALKKYPPCCPACGECYITTLVPYPADAGGDGRVRQEIGPDGYIVPEDRDLVVKALQRAAQQYDADHHIHDHRSGAYGGG